MLYQLQVKADNQRVYRKLSVKMRSVDALKKDLESYVIMYAEDNQLNWHTISAQITTKSFNVYLNNDVIVSAKCRTTGRFVKRAIAQLELNAELKARTNIEQRVTMLQAHNIKQAARMKDRLNMQAKQNVNKVINSSLVEKTKVQLQSSIAKVVMLGMITLSAFNMA